MVSRPSADEKAINLLEAATAPAAPSRRHRGDLNVTESAPGRTWCGTSLRRTVAAVRRRPRALPRHSTQTSSPVIDDGGTHMRTSRLMLTAAAGAALGLLVAGPASSATTG